MLIEFLGAPGTGKSSVARELSRLRGLPSLTVDGYRNLEGERIPPWRIRISRWVALLAQPWSWRDVISCWRREGTGPALSWAINLARRNRVVRSARGRDLLLEEGTLSALLLRQAASTSDLDVSQILRNLVVGDVVIYLHIDQEANVERLYARQGILSDWSEEEIYDLIGGYKAGVPEVLSRLTVPVYEFSTDEEPAIVAQQIADRLWGSG